jgi:fermentation-respiration switch protein FrsA (DUF1100 family)
MPSAVQFRIHGRRSFCAVAPRERIGYVKRGMRTAILGILLVMGAGGIVHGIRSVARSYLFPASQVPAGATPEGFESHTLIARDGVTVHALELRAPPGARTIVHFHNNRQTAESGAEIARELHARGFGVLLVEYRGYGASRDGVSTEDGLYLDAECALDMLASRGVTTEQIVLWGTSLGTGVAAEMARRGRGAHLLLVTPYTSIPGLVADIVPFLPAALLVPDHFDTLAKSSDIHVPTLIIHGDADEIVPYWMGERLARAISGARILRIAGAHHGDLFARDGEHLLAAIVAFGT